MEVYKTLSVIFLIILLQTTSATSNSVTGVSSWIVIHGPQWSAPPRSRPLGWKWAAWRRDGGSSRTAYVWNNDQCGYHVSCLTLWALGDAPRAGHVQYQPRKERLFPSQALEKSRLQSTCVKICGEYSWVYSSNLWISTYFIYFLINQHIYVFLWHPHDFMVYHPFLHARFVRAPNSGSLVDGWNMFHAAGVESTIYWPGGGE